LIFYVCAVSSITLKGVREVAPLVRHSRQPKTTNVLSITSLIARTSNLASSHPALPYSRSFRCGPKRRYGLCLLHLTSEAVCSRFMVIQRKRTGAKTTDGYVFPLPSAICTLGDNRRATPKVPSENDLSCGYTVSRS